MRPGSRANIVNLVDHVRNSETAFPGYARAVNRLDPDATSEPRATPRMVVTSALFWSYMLITNPLLWMGAVVLFVLSAPFDRRRRLLHLYTSAWAYHYIKILPLWSTEFRGVDQIERDRTYVLVANHQSLGDILLLFGLFRHFKWVSKREIFRVPFIGWNMRMNDYVGLVRGDAASIEKMLSECRAHLRRGSSVMLFPEGTRSEDGEMKAFKRGAFTLAKELDLPIVPVVIDGTRDVLPKHGLMLRQERMLRMRVSVLEPVAASACADARELGDLVRERMVRELARLRAEKSAADV